MSSTPAPRRFLELEGLRAAAAYGVLITHVSFQTGVNATPVIGRVFARFDLAVAVFFALSGFLLWRSMAESTDLASIKRYFVHRAARIFPAYWAVVALVFVVFAHVRDARMWATNLLLVQPFVPLSYTEELTQMWSLSVECGFYVLLPVVALALGRRRSTARVVMMLGIAAISLGWAWVPISVADGVNSTTWLPGFVPWFVAGMVLAELATHDSKSVVERALTWFASRRWLAFAAAAVAFGLACTDLAGPPDLTSVARWHFAVKIALGAVIAFGLLGPMVLAERAHAVLASDAAQLLGRWSYGIFLWHLVALIAIFEVFAMPQFSGRFIEVLVLTVVLATVCGGVSFGLVERPIRRGANAWADRRWPMNTPVEDGGTDRRDQRELNPRSVS